MEISKTKGEFEVLFNYIYFMQKTIPRRKFVREFSRPIISNAIMEVLSRAGEEDIIKLINFGIPEWNVYIINHYKEDIKNHKEVCDELMKNRSIQTKVELARYISGKERIKRLMESNNPEVCKSVMLNKYTKEKDLPSLMDEYINLGIRRMIKKEQSCSMGVYSLYYSGLDMCFIENTLNIMDASDRDRIVEKYYFKETEAQGEESLKKNLYPMLNGTMKTLASL